MMQEAPSALSLSRVLKTHGTGMGVLRTANAFGALQSRVLKTPGMAHDAIAPPALSRPKDAPAKPRSEVL